MIDTAFSISSWMRRTCASTSIVFSAFSGSGVICARSDVPVRVYDIGAHARESLDDDVDAAARRLGHLPNHADRADAFQVLGGGLVGVVLLEDEQDQPVGAERAVDAFHRHRPVDGQRLQRLRKDHRVTERQDREL